MRRTRLAQTLKPSKRENSGGKKHAKHWGKRQETAGRAKGVVYSGSRDQIIKIKK